MKLSTLAQTLGLDRPAKDIDIAGVNSLELAGPQELSFLAHIKDAKKLEDCRAGAIIAPPGATSKTAVMLHSPQPHLHFAMATGQFAPPRGDFQGISDRAVVAPSATIDPAARIAPTAYIGENATIGANTVIFPGAFVGERCTLGTGCTIYPNVTLMPDTVVGNDVIIQPGASIGGDGFGYVPGPAGLQKVPHVGRVVIEDRVEIGANTTIDRAVLNETRIGAGTKIDNLVQIAHNVTTGQHCIIISQTGISGSTTLGNQVTIAGQVGVTDHLTIGDGATLAPKTGVAQDIPPGKIMGGVPSMEAGTYRRVLAITPKLPEMYKRMRSLEKELDALKRLAQHEGDQT